MGAVSPLGCGVEPIWQRLLAGQSGIATLPAELIGDLPISIGGQVPDRVQDPQAGFDPDLLLAAKEQRKMDRFILFALAAAQEALAQAGWAPQSTEAQERTATVIASGVGGFHVQRFAAGLRSGHGGFAGRNDDEGMFVPGLRLQAAIPEQLAQCLFGGETPLQRGRLAAGAEIASEKDLYRGLLREGVDRLAERRGGQIHVELFLALGRHRQEQAAGEQ